MRTCQTAIHIFKNHPNKSQIRFIVLPLVKEGINTGYDYCLSVEHMRTIIEPLAEEHGLTFDYSLLYVFGIPDLSQANVAIDVGQV